jgi:hypothetical protein
MSTSSHKYIATSLVVSCTIDIFQTVAICYVLLCPHTYLATLFPALVDDVIFTHIRVMNKLIYPASGSLYFHNAVAQVVEHHGQYIRVNWHAVPMYSSSLREVYEHVLRLLIEARLDRVLCDHHCMPAIMPQDQEWLATDWVVRAVREGGYRHCAIVESTDVFNRLGTNHIVQRLRGTLPLTVSYFSDSTSAEQWLLESGLRRQAS